MSGFHSVVTEQKVFICAVCTFIGKLLRAVLPDVAWDNAFLQSEDDFSASLDGVIRKHALEGSNEGDCRLAMAQMACNRMKHVCDLLKRISESVGLKGIAGRYLDAPWFIDMLLRKDTSKLNKLYYTIDFTDEKPSRILMNVAAILEGRTDGYDAMSARAKRKADRETKALIEKVGERVESLHGKVDASKTELATKIDMGNKAIAGKIESVREELHETKEELLSRADALIRKLGNVNLGGKRNGRHTTEQKKVCLSCWMSAQTNEELKSGTSNGKATREAAFKWYRRELELVKVVTLEKFIDVLNTVKVTRSASNIKALEAKREAERKAKKCGTIRGMNRRKMV